MNWWMQIWHVVKKDLRQFWWLLSAQVVATAFALRTSLSPGLHGEFGFGFRFDYQYESAMVALLVLAVLISALVVQADSPSRSDAFWASRPFRPLAVLVAKGVTLGVFLIALPLAAEAAVLLQHAVPATEMMPMLAQGLVLQGAVVIAAATLAAFTADLGALVMAGLGAGAAGFAVVFVIFWFGDGAFFRYNTFMDLWPVIVLGLPVLAYQYSSRNLRRSVIGVTLGSVAALVLVGWTGSLGARPSELPATASTEAVRTELRLQAFEVEQMPANAGQAPTWRLWATVHLEDANPRFEYALRDLTARLRGLDGRVRRIHISRPFQVGPQANPTGDIEWLFESNGTEVSGGRIELARISYPEVQVLAGGGGRLELEARVEVLSVEPWGSLPLVIGASLTHESSQARVVSVGPSRVQFFMETIRAGNVPDLESEGYTRFALVNREHGQGLVVPTATVGNRVHGLILESGVLARSQFVELVVPWVYTDGSRSLAVDEAWTAGAEVMIIRSRSVGGYPIALDQDVRIELDESGQR